MQIHETNLIRDISPDDLMFRGNHTHYFSVGKSALENIAHALAAAGAGDNVRRILDLPCGHGRVMRYLRTAYPEAEITGCDLLRGGVEYCARTFGAIPLHSQDECAKIGLKDDYFDLIWVGSLMTHFDSQRWGEFLDGFRRSLRRGGVLVFTTHGRRAYDRLVQGEYGPDPDTAAARSSFGQSGFWYRNYSDSNTYGLSLSRPDWVLTQICAIKELKVVHFAEMAWDRHQDVYACIRELGWPMHRAHSVTNAPHLTEARRASPWKALRSLITRQ